MTRRTILIVEDEYFIADDCTRLLRAAGFDVVGPFRRVEEALQGLSTQVDGALLDINLDGESIYPLLDKLLLNNIPITLYTGYEVSALPLKYARLPVVTKPSGCADAIDQLRQQL